MYKVIYTKTLDNANDIIAESWEYEKYEDAVDLFNERIRMLTDATLKNDYLECKMSIYRHKACFKIEGSHYCIAITNDEEMLHNAGKSVI